MQSSRPQVVAFLEAIKENPDDEAPRLILADWLMEQGDEARGEFVALQCRLAALDPADPAWAPAEARCGELLLEHGADWVRPLREGLAHGKMEWQFHRGLLTLRLNAARLRKLAEKTAGWTEFWAWVELVQLAGLKGSLNAVTHLTLVSQITGLDLSDGEIGDDGLEALAESPFLTRLNTLLLGNSQISTTGALLLAQSPLMGRLAELGLRQNVIDDGGLAFLAAAKSFRLTRLDLANNVLQLTNPRVLKSLSQLAQLVRLDLSDNQLDPRGVQALATLRWNQLTNLYLDRTKLGDEGVKVLAASPELGRLTTLSLQGNAITVEGAMALVDSPYLTRLRCLRLGKNRLGAGALTALTARFGNALQLA